MSQAPGSKFPLKCLRRKKPPLWGLSTQDLLLSTQHKGRVKSLENGCWKTRCTARSLIAVVVKGELQSEKTLPRQSHCHEARPASLSTTSSTMTHGPTSRAPLKGNNLSLRIPEKQCQPWLRKSSSKRVSLLRRPRCHASSSNQFAWAALNFSPHA